MKKKNKAGKPPGSEATEPATSSGVDNEPQAAEGPNSLKLAREKMIEALDQTAKRSRVALAKEALSLSKNCTEAYILLAEESSKSLEDAARLYKEGMDAARRVLGEEPFKRYVGRFWSRNETRPYMSAFLGHANCLWDMGKSEEAIDEYYELLRLNRDDSQGIRFILAPALIEAERYQEAREFIKKENDKISLPIKFSRALITFLMDGETEEAESALKDAFEYNPFFLQAFQDFAQSKFEHKEIPYYTLGSYEEAYAYIQNWYSAWATATEHGTPLAWAIVCGDKFAKKRTVYEIFPDLKPGSNSISMDDFKFKK